MKIEYLGHSCFRLDDCLVVDPYTDGSVPGFSPLKVGAVRVICSHEHADHNWKVSVVIASSGKCNLKVGEVASFHDNVRGAFRGSNKIFVVMAPDGEKLVHLGDLGHFPDERQLAAISGADYLLIPVGGYYTIDAKTAVDICKAAEPKWIIPMHYRTDTSGYPELATVDPFMKLAEKEGIVDKVKVMKMGDVFTGDD